MSNIRETRKSKLNVRTHVEKGMGCKFCPNNKMHTDGVRYWCTKCKRER